MIEIVEREALSYARENGMKGEVLVSEVHVAEYGFEVVVNDSEGRMAQVRFTKDGKPSMWEMMSR